MSSKVAACESSTEQHKDKLVTCEIPDLPEELIKLQQDQPVLAAYLVKMNDVIRNQREQLTEKQGIIGDLLTKLDSNQPGSCTTTMENQMAVYGDNQLAVDGATNSVEKTPEVQNPATIESQSPKSDTELEKALTDFKIEMFNGDKSKFPQWMQTFTTLKKLYGLRDQAMRCLLMLFLTGDAQSWWKCNEDFYHTWEDIEKALHEEFTNKMPGFIMWSRITTYGQRYGQRVSDYVYLMLEQFDLFLTNPPDEQQQIDLVYGGLHPTILRSIYACSVSRNQINTLADLRFKFEQAENYLISRGFWPTTCNGTGLGDRRKIRKKWMQREERRERSQGCKY